MVAAAGADAIGVNLWPGSKRHVTADAARDILAAIPAGMLKVGVFVDAPADEVERRFARWDWTARSFTATRPPRPSGDSMRAWCASFACATNRRSNARPAGRPRSGSMTRTSMGTAAPACWRPGR